MRILFLANMYPPYDIGGYEQICHEVAIGLRDRGHTVKILTSRYGLSSPIPSENDVIRTLHLEADLNYYHPGDYFFSRSSREHFNILELRTVLQEFSPDVAVVWGMYLLSVNLPYWLEQWMPGRIVYYIASYWPKDQDPHSSYWRLPARSMIGEQIKKPLRALALSQLRRENYPPTLQFTRTLCCSEYVKDILIKAGSIPESSGVLHIGIDPEPFTNHIGQNKQINKGVLRLLYFGRLIEDKGVHTAIEALGLLKQHGYSENINLTILGSGHPDYESRLHLLIKKFSLENQINIAGKVPREHIPTMLLDFDVFLFTSIWPEPFGRTIIEAMLAGLIVVGSDVGGSREIFSYYDTDLLYPAGDANILASRIAMLMDGSKDKGKLVQCGKKLALESFSLDIMISRLENYLFDLVDQNKIIASATPHL